MSKDPTPWVWGRVAGDALDIGTLVTHMNDDNPEEANVAMALGNVVAVTAVDIYCAQRLSREGGHGEELYDYSDRSGFPHGSQTISEGTTSYLGSQSAAQRVD